MENITLASSCDTFLEMHGSHDLPQNKNAWIVPTFNGGPRYNKPPLAIWVNLLAWSDLTPATTNPRQLMTRARIASVMVGFLMIASIYWLGLSVGNIHTGLLSALFVSTTILFQKQARLSSYDIYLASFATFSVAAAWWSIGPHRPDRVFTKLRFVMGWILCGMGLGAAIMSKGPLAYPLMILPVAYGIILHRHQLKRNLGGMILALAIGTALAFPWYYHIETLYQGLSGSMSSEFTAKRTVGQPVYYYLCIIGLIWPWTVIFFGSLFQPWGLAQKNRRKQMLYAWGWMALILLMFSIPGAKQQRYILPILPAFGLLFGAFWVDHQRITDSGHQDKDLNFVRLPHWIMLGGASIAATIAILAQPLLIEHGYEQYAILGSVKTSLVLFWLVLCLDIVYLGFKSHMKNQHIKAGYLSATWALLFTIMLLHAYALGPKQHHPVYNEAAKFNQIVQGAPVRFLHVQDHHDDINEEFAFFSMRRFPIITVEQLQAFVESSQYPSDKPRYVMLLDNDLMSEKLTAMGLRQRLVFNQDYHSNYKMTTYLWQIPAKP
ncbi:MAG: hypothetical protein KUG81_04835 [Gammaproteobacteria bacterium]|nr:hypothetical protein [Gammaproteobacteria bacterium]